MVAGAGGELGEEDEERVVGPAEEAVQVAGGIPGGGLPADGVVQVLLRERVGLGQRLRALEVRLRDLVGGLVALQRRLRAPGEATSS